MNKKLRLVLWETCNRSCEGCCNRDYDIPHLPVCQSFMGYDTIILTGGEPLLYPERVKAIITEIRAETDAPIILYTAKTDDIPALIEIADMINGLTVTLHDTLDVKPFLDFDQEYALCRGSRGKREQNKSFRLNIFAGVNIDLGEITGKWKIKSDIKWIKNCPIPEGEILMKYDLDDDYLKSLMDKGHR